MSDDHTSEAVEHPLDLEALRTFNFDRVLSESTSTGSVYLYGTLHGTPAILHIQRTLLPSDTAAGTVQSGLESLNVFLDNRPYFSAHALLRRTDGSVPDIQVKAIWPATDVHVRKYTTQERVMVTETPEMYKNIVVPYIESFPPDRIQWVFNILDGKKEADKILYRDDDNEKGFVILPDLKWDETSMNALYLTAIVKTRGIRTLRDLTSKHISLLKDIRHQARSIANDKYGVDAGKLRMFIHYQPSYYHFHVHVAHIYHEGGAGMMVGQAHLLDDVISLLELSDDDGESLLAKMTLTYPLGVEHKLYPLISCKEEARPTSSLGKRMQRDGEGGAE